MNKALAMALTLLLAAGAAGAQTLCRFDTSASLNFGGYDILALQPRDSQTDVRVTCTRNGGPQNVSVTVGIGPSSNSGSTSSRALARIGGSGTLNYALYRDSSRTLLWGNTAGSDAATQVVAVPNRDSASLTFTIYGRIPAQQGVLAGSYTDALQLTVTP